MAWFKVDDGLAMHSKVVVAGNAAMGLWVRAGAWCAQQGTDGRVPKHLVAALGGTRAHARTLVEAGLWEGDGDDYVFHDWLHFQPSAAEVRAEQARKSEVKQRAGRLGGIASGVARRKHEGSRGEADSKQTASETKPRPDPTRPDPASVGLGEEVDVDVPRARERAADRDVPGSTSLRLLPPDPNDPEAIGDFLAAAGWEQ